MKDSLPKSIKTNDTGILNLDNSNGPLTHWVCYKKLGKSVYYFDTVVFGIYNRRRIYKIISDRLQKFFTLTREDNLKIHPFADIYVKSV